MKILSLNANNFLGSTGTKYEFSNLREWASWREENFDFILNNIVNISEKIKELSPDLIFLFEIDVQEIKWIREKLSPAYELTTPTKFREHTYQDNRSITLAFRKKGIEENRVPCNSLDEWLRNIELKANDISIVGIHRKMDNEHGKDLINDVRELSKDNKPIVILGDLNISDNSYEKDKKLIGELEEMGFTHCENNHPTFIADTIIDHAFIKGIENYRLNATTTIIKEGLSDHEALILTIE